MKSELFFSYTYNMDLFYFTTQMSKVNTSKFIFFFVYFQFGKGRRKAMPPPYNRHKKRKYRNVAKLI